jgi:DNA topoisomerase-1
MGQVLDAIDTALAPHLFPAQGDGSDPRACPVCGTGRLSLKAGRYGAFIGCSNYPECRMTRPVGATNGEDADAAGERELGVDPETGHAVWLKIGRFGPYVEESGDPVRRASLPRDWPPAGMDLERALRLLRLPREVGPHPQDGQMIFAGVGRYGPYVQHQRTYANLANVDEVFDLGLNRAVTLLAEKVAGKGRRGGTGELRQLGEHPRSGKPVRLLSGRYGPYVAHDGVNANLPRGADPADLTLEQATALLAAREGAPRKARGKPAKAVGTPKRRKTRATAKAKG